MELASAESILALMPGRRDSVRVRIRPGMRSATRPSTKLKKTRCKCGQCRQCQEDERWERIFAEKFADPDYYNRPVPRMASPLTSC
jgi:hypothetical protein